MGARAMGAGGATEAGASRGGESAGAGAGGSAAAQAESESIETSAPRCMKAPIMKAHRGGRTVRDGYSVSSITRCSSPRPLLIPLMRASFW